MRENRIEKNRKKYYEKKLKGLYPKFVNPGEKAWPDRLVLLPIDDEEHRVIIAKYFWFEELKAPGKKPRADQTRNHKALRKLGYKVIVSDKKIEEE
jgi:hypothetical protein